MIKKLLILFVVILLFFCKNGISQSFLNGDFELNSATNGVDQIALTNSQFNPMISNVYSFGTSPTGLDLVTTSVWDGGPYTGNWYLGIEGGGIEQFSLELSSPLISGTTYRISFFDRGRAVHPSAPIEIGVSLVNNNFGTLIYTAPEPEFGVWNLRCFTFTAPSNVTFITVKGGNSPGSWTKLDNFIIDFDTLKSCAEMAEITMPNIFTPNGDGINDFFAPVELTNITEASMSIINRWGQTLYVTEDLISGWDGSDNGSPYSDGTYFWLIHYTDANNERKSAYGIFSLLK
ncbi:MAG: gliding motility-associated C-terminal domain-containing protein [Crocinitomicaceae bacterium]|jgi:gliding motility-associated-like protein|nr:gliding motility-associated C-terminal domain-containing protein [Crocinitomicaceae bacterium]MBK8924994.1 gliding motility-associated C-terminal domain-containing protein [Crocinitomicaceae bacterium]